MPELPEVETVRRGLARHLVGRTIVGVTQRRTALRLPMPLDFAARLSGRRVLAVERRAKYLLFPLEGEDVMIAHLGMSGRFHLWPPEADPTASGREMGKHVHVIFDLDDGSRLAYEDARRFGLLTLARRSDLAEHPLLRDLGLEPLAPDFTPAALARVLAGRRAPIKAALLDQRGIAGLGNIYVCEALFRAHVAPHRPAASLSSAEIAHLVAAIRAVLLEAIAAGGSSLRDYVQADGELGYFQHRFAVYDRAGARCPTPGCGGSIRRLIHQGRSSFYCPQCQH